MAPNSIIHLIRHAEGFHQLPRDHPHVDIRDPNLTLHGVEQSKQLCERFIYHAQTDLLCASPLQRTIQTAMLAFAPETERGLKIVAVPDAQEATEAPSDTGNDVSVLKSKFGDAVDYSELEGAWYEKTGKNATDTASLHARARRLRLWLRSRPEKHIVVVSHGLFAHYITAHIDDQGNQTGEYWVNVMWRTFGFRNADDEDAAFVETEESMRRHGTEETDNP